MNSSHTDLTNLTKAYIAIARMEPSGWRNEAFRGSTKCRAVLSEGSTVLCATEEHASIRCVICEICEICER